jgi:hypothetical protein
MSEYDFTGGIGEAELQELAELRVQKWRADAISKHPGAKPFEDLLVASSAQAMDELAEDLASRVQGPGANVPTTYAGPMVVGGSPALPPAPNDAEELAALKDEARRSGDWSNILRTLRERAVQRAERGF